jgi:hypothetical protein
MNDQEIEGIKDFIKLARQGKRTSGSSGERAAFRLANAAEVVSSSMQDLDGEKQEAFLNLLRGLAWPDTRDMLLKALPK